MTLAVEQPHVSATAEPTLAELEAVIYANLDAFFKVGDALTRIRDGRLYKTTHSTFEAYCEARFNFNRQRASQLIKAAKVSRILDKPPARASHAEALAPLADNPELVRQVDAEVRAATGDKPKAADYTHAVGQVRRSVSSKAEATDSQDIPDELIVQPPAEPGDLIEAGAFDVNQETYRQPGLTGQRCGICGDRFAGAVCPCTTAEPVPGGSVPVDVDVSPWVGQIFRDVANGNIRDGDEVAMDIPNLLPSIPFDGNTTMQLLRELHRAGLTSSDDPFKTPRWTLTVQPTATPDQPGRSEGVVSAAPVDAEPPVPSTPAPPAVPAAASAYGSPSVHPVGSDAWVMERRAASGVDGQAARTYSLGLSALMPLTDLDPAAIVAGLDPEQWEAAKARHDAIKSWLTAVEYQIFLAKQRATRQGAA